MRARQIFVAAVFIAVVLVMPAATAAAASAEPQPADQTTAVVEAGNGGMDTQLFDYHSIADLFDYHKVADARKTACLFDYH